MKNIEEKVIAEIDRLSGKYLDLLVDICNIESKSDNKEGVDKVGDYLADHASQMGYSIVKKEFERAGNVYSFTMNPDGEKEMVSLSAHMDTVFEKGVFGYPPTKIDGDYIYGPGVQDCKGGIAIFLLCMEALKNCGYTERPIKLILQSDEEVSSNISDRGTIDFMIQEAKGSAAFFNGEGCKNGHITVARKGIVKKKIIIKGYAVHAGNYVGGISAIREAAYKIIELEKDSDVNSITFNCGIIKGGSTINTIPDSCEVYVEYRFKTVEEQRMAEEKFQRIVSTSYVEGTESISEEISARLPMERTKDNEKLAEFVSSISEKYGFEKLKLSESPGGADAAYATAAGIPSVDGIGIEGFACHSTREKALIASIPKLAKIIAGALINFPDKL